MWKKGLLLFVLLVAALAQPTRYITFTNQCSIGYYLHPVPNSNPAGSSCVTDADCVIGSGFTCQNTSATVRACYYFIPESNTSSFLVPSGQAISLAFPYSPNTYTNEYWGGNFAFCAENQPCAANATLCSELGCASGVGYSSPAPEIEFTLTTGSIGGGDFYDVSLIGGILMPLAIRPTNLNSPPVANSPYVCSSPGAPIASPGLGASDWVLDPPDVSFQYVFPGEVSCTSNAECGADEVCGLAYNLEATGNPYQLNCGALQGYWSPFAICAGPPGWNTPTPFNCSSLVNASMGQETFGKFIQCDGTSQSCYNLTADSGCCGCPHWNETIGTTLMPPGSDVVCGNSNPLWTSEVLPLLTWMKKACPTCYTYSYDDLTSSFMCYQLENGINNLNYEVTLCPNA